MAAKEAKVSYDPEEDILHVYLGVSISDSFQQGDYVIDFSKDNRIVGVEIFNASRNVFAGIQQPEELDIKKSLVSVKKALFGIHQERQLVWIGILFVMQMQNKEQTQAMRIGIPHGIFSK